LSKIKITLVKCLLKIAFHFVPVKLSFSEIVDLIDLIDIDFIFTKTIRYK